MKTAIFDLDGTLADTSGDLIAAANACFDRLGYGMPLDAIGDKETAFKGGMAMLDLGYRRLSIAQSKNQIKQHYGQLLKNYQQSIDHHSSLYNGVINSLTELINRGYHLGVCTNKPQYLALKLLRRLNIKQYFKAILGIDSFSVCKPHPQHLLETIKRIGGTSDKAVLVGDSATDRQTAKNAQVLCVLVGFSDKQAMKALMPDALLDHYDDLPNLLDQLLQKNMPKYNNTPACKRSYNY